MQCFGILIEENEETKLMSRSLVETLGEKLNHELVNAILDGVTIFFKDSETH
jgi:hypothetical protein